ncbi:hypothetical protein PsYK624_117480 [Phanerochaete sordida]|uniref:BTB domain-containing protein n=1 Tax=Phanerochaete sordida TaxID=48140 RepID=A0A9P3LIV3_9APHY|nr:hypothetical protein PsYK624_117480 [Phanerochaete sordida]
MFSMPQPTGSAPSEKPPVVEIAESSRTLEYLLLYCYPVRDPYISTCDFNALDRVFGAAKKYDFAEAIELVRNRLDNVSKSYPLPVFAIACQHDDEILAKAAATCWRNTCFTQPTLFSLLPASQADSMTRWRTSWLSSKFHETLVDQSYDFEMEGRLTAGSLFRLLQYVKSGQITSFVSPPPFSSRATSSRQLVPTEEVATAKTQYPFSDANADLVVRSCDGHQFRVHRAILEMLLDPSTPESSSCLASAFGESSMTTGFDALPLYDLKDRSHTLVNLLRQCYPTSATIADWDIDTLGCEVALRVYLAAQQYGFIPVLRAYRSRMHQLLPQAPLDVYCIAVALGCTDEPEAAARQLAFSNLRDMYSPKLECLPVKDYHRLLEYHHACQVAIRAVWQDHFPHTQSTPRPTIAHTVTGPYGAYNLFNVRTSVPAPDPALAQFEWLEDAGVASARDCIWQTVLEQEVDTTNTSNRSHSVGQPRVDRAAIADTRAKVEKAVDAGLDAVTFRHEDVSSQDKTP